LQGLILAHTAAFLEKYMERSQQLVLAHQGEPWFPEAYRASRSLEGIDYDHAILAAAWRGTLPFFFARWTAVEQRIADYITSFPFEPVPLRYHSDLESASLDFTQALSRLRVPTLVLAGRHDVAIPLEASLELVELIAGARLRVFEQSGHFASWEEPRAFAEAVQAFVLERSGAI